jgi:hypothetical protein
VDPCRLRRASHSDTRVRVKSDVSQPDRDRVAVAEVELPAQVDLAEQLDLVGRISALSGLDGLKGEPR